MIDRIRYLRSEKSDIPFYPMDFQNDGEFVGGCIAGGRNYFHINSCLLYTSCGNMGGAIARAVCKATEPENVFLANRTAAKAEALAAELRCV